MIETGIVDRSDVVKNFVQPSTQPLTAGENNCVRVAVFEPCGSLRELMKSVVSNKFSENSPVHPHLIEAPHEGTFFSFLKNVEDETSPEKIEEMRNAFKSAVFVINLGRKFEREIKKGVRDLFEELGGRPDNIFLYREGMSHITEVRRIAERIDLVANSFAVRH